MSLICEVQIVITNLASIDVTQPVPVQIGVTTTEGPTTVDVALGPNWELSMDGLNTISISVGDSAPAVGHVHLNIDELALITDGDHDVRTDNPHNVNKADVGLANVPDLDTTATVSAAHIHANAAALDAVTGTNTGDHDSLSSATRPTWPNYTEAQAAGFLNPFIDQNRVRRYEDTAHMAIGARWPMGGDNAIHLSERSLKWVNPRKALEQLAQNTVAAYTAQEGWKQVHADYAGFFNSTYYERILDWLKPGLMEGGVEPAFGSVPYVHHLRPHGGVSKRESYGYFDALEAAELGQPWLVDGYYQMLRHFRNLGIDHLVHLGKPDRNQEWQWRSDEAKARIIEQFDYGHGVSILDNAIASDANSASYQVIAGQLAKGIGSGVEGTPKRSNTVWNSSSCPILSWSDTSHGRHIAGDGSTYVVIGADSEFGDLYGEREWIFSFGSSHFSYYGTGLTSIPLWTETADITTYLDAIAVKTRDYFTAFDAQPNQGTPICVLDHRIINLAIVSGRTTADFS